MDSVSIIRFWGAIVVLLALFFAVRADTLSRLTEARRIDLSLRFVKYEVWAADHQSDIMRDIEARQWSCGKEKGYGR